MKTFTFSLLLLFLSVYTLAYDDGIRIAWDYNQRNYHNAGVYARMKKLRNSDLVLVYSYGTDVFIRKQSSKDNYWSTAILVSRDNLSDYNYTNSEIIELENGKLIYTWNARPKSGTDKPYKIMLKYSDDGGETWYSERDVYIAGTIPEEGCWEPVFLQLPSGELQLYFASEHHVTVRYQNITMLRSFDNGETWQSPEIISFRDGSRDGMPVPVYLRDNKGIACAIEDNGINGYFKPVIIYTDTDDNWLSGTVLGNSPKRWHALRSDYQLGRDTYGGAPYLIQLTSKETVLAFQSQEGRTGSSHEYSIMQVYIGDEGAKNFSRKSTPFPYLTSSAQALWNSIHQIDDSTVVAVSSLSGLAENNGIWSVKGKIIQPMESVEKQSGEEGWSKPIPVFIGAESQANMYVKSKWDKDSIYFFFDVKDRKLTIAEENAPLWDTDGIEVYLDTKNASSNALVSGLHKLLVNIDGKTLLNRSSGSQWLAWNPDICYRIDTNLTGYAIELSIPWKDLGGIPDNSFGVHFKLHNHNGNTATIVHENLSGGNPDRSKTWLKCTLINASSSGIRADSGKKQNQLIIYRCDTENNGNFIIKLAEGDLTNAYIRVYNAMNGCLLYKGVSYLHPKKYSFYRSRDSSG